MNKQTQTKDLASISEEACGWIIKLGEGPNSKEDIQALKAWMARSPKHRIELIEVSRLWDGIDDMLREEILSPESVHDNGSTIWDSIKRNAVVAASVAVVFLFAQFVGKDTATPAPAFYTAALGEQKTVSLSDGSKVILNTDSQIEVLYSAKFRNIRLLRGEALFDVEKNKDRPFQVYAGTGVVQAVGTIFSVFLDKSNIEVTVSEGSVELSTFSAAPQALSPGISDNGQPLSLAKLEVGHSAIFNHVVEKLEFLDLDVIEDKLAWQTGTLVFKEQALEQVIKEISRYTKLEFVLSEQDVRDLKVTGYFYTADIDKLLSAIEFSLGIDVERSDRGIVYLSKAKQVNNQE